MSNDNSLKNDNFMLYNSIDLIIQMNKLKILIITYILGVIIGALFFDVWGINTTFIKTMSIFLWTIIFLIALFYVDKNEKK